MAWYRAELTVPVPIDEAFAYLAAFDNVRDWDPSVTRAQRVFGADAAPTLGEGSAFDVSLRFLGRETTLRYEITGYDEPHQVIVRGVSPTVTSIDTMTLVPAGGGTRVTYHVDLRLHGAWRVFDAALQRLFRPMAEAAIAGLQRELTALVVAAAPDAPVVPAAPVFPARRPTLDPDHPSFGAAA